MAERRPRGRRRMGAVLPAILLLAASPVVAQRTSPRIVEWPVRNGALPGALLTGAAALFWNPAGVLALPGRAEASLVDVVGPDGIEVDILALSAAARLGERAAVGLGFAHFGLDDIPVTTTSPIPDPGSGTVDVGEQELSLAGAYALPGDLTLGAGLRYARAKLGERAEARAGATAGARWTPPLPGGPVLAASVLRQGGAVRWLAGLAASLPAPEDRPWTLRGGYGVSGGGGALPSAHTVSLTGAWGSRVGRVAALAAEPDGAGRDWLPLLGADLRLGRYVLGVVREELPNDFGAAYSYRLDITF
ncbi:MAG TPA: hypothetical protein VMK65_13540 [Longimicrobiales bacterium]|nr:hypothetical protein [Longimicrobiales bacterium]